MKVTGQVLECSTDLDCDGQVAASDLAVILAGFGLTCKEYPDVCAYDFNGDGQIAVDDIQYVLDHWGPCS